MIGLAVVAGLVLLLILTAGAIFWVVESLNVAPSDSGHEDTPRQQPITDKVTAHQDPIAMVVVPSTDPGLTLNALGGEDYSKCFFEQCKSYITILTQDKKINQFVGETASNRFATLSPNRQYLLTNDNNNLIRYSQGEITRFTNDRIEENLSIQEIDDSGIIYNSRMVNLLQSPLSEHGPFDVDRVWQLDIWGGSQPQSLLISLYGTTIPHHELIACDHDLYYFGQRVDERGELHQANEWVFNQDRNTFESLGRYDAFSDNVDNDYRFCRHDGTHTFDVAVMDLDTLRVRTWREDGGYSPDEERYMIGARDIGGIRIFPSRIIINTADKELLIIDRRTGNQEQIDVFSSHTSDGANPLHKDSSVLTVQEDKVFIFGPDQSHRKWLATSYTYESKQLGPITTVPLFDESYPSFNIKSIEIGDEDIVQQWLVSQPTYNHE